MEPNPFSDGKIRSQSDAIVRAIVIGVAAAVAWNAPYEWYWRVAIFFGLLLIIGAIYPAVHLKLALRKRRKLLDSTESTKDREFRGLVRQLNPAIADSMDETREFEIKMGVISDALKKGEKGTPP